uniref:Uncharacterized protein n=1 Tax=Homalodisca liturata TaxID=320908 RepID=A0A1B6HFN0_9HEMI
MESDPNRDKYNRDRRNKEYKRMHDWANTFPRFWPIALMNHEAVANIIAEEEKDCLNYMTDFYIDEPETGNGHRFNFVFKTNPYFTNQVLSRQYRLDDHLRILPSYINWIDGNNLLQLVMRNYTVKKEPPTRWQKYELSRQTFFTWFSDRSTLNIDRIGDVIG